MAAAKEGGEEAARRLKNFERMVDDFLEQSDYERVEGLGAILRV